MTRRSVLLAALCGVVLLAGGAGAGYFLRPAPPPASLAAPVSAVKAPVTTQMFTDSRKVQIRLIPGADVAVTVNRSGVLTDTTCTPGSTVASGTVVAKIDDTPALALHLDVPPFRDLAMDTEGSDVTALQNELNRLGAGSLEADGYFGWDTAVAVETLRESVGMSEGRALALSELMWLPRESLAVTECSTGLGTRLAPGGPFAIAKGTLQQLVIDTLPADLVAGERVLTVFGVTGTLQGGNSISEPEFLSQLAGTEQARALLSQDPSTTAPATLQLSAALAALQVPAAAVFGMSPTGGCIQAGDAVYPVTVLGSSLGASLISLSTSDGGDIVAATPEVVNIGAAITHESCHP